MQKENLDTKLVKYFESKKDINDFMADILVCGIVAGVVIGGATAGLRHVHSKFTDEKKIEQIKEHKEKEAVYKKIGNLTRENIPALYMAAIKAQNTRA